MVFHFIYTYIALYIMTLLAIAADMSQYIFIEIQVSYKKCMSNISKWYEQQKSKIKYFFIKTITKKYE